MIDVLPAIDIRGGRCVRLVQGDYDRETVFDDNPTAPAQRWIDQGAEMLHVIDLDGAREGHAANAEFVERIVVLAAVRSSRTSRNLRSRSAATSTPAVPGSSSARGGDRRGIPPRRGLCPRP